MVYRPALFVALIALTMAAYWPTAGAGFVWEDHNSDGAIYAPCTDGAYEGVAFGRTQLGRWQGIPAPRFLTAATYRLNACLAPSAVAFHAVNLGLHLLNVALVFALAWPLLGDWSAFAAGVFALHPLQVEAVMGVAYRGELLATSYVLLAIAAARLEGPGPWAAYLALLCGLGALAAKETTAAVLLFAWPWLAPAGRRALPLLGWWPVALAGGALMLRTPKLLAGAAFWRHVVLQGAGFWVLIWRAAVPLTQTVDLDLGAVPARVAIWPAVVLALMATGLAFAARGRGKWIVAAFVWTAACLYLRILTPGTELLHEHAMYLPMAGVGVGLAAALGNIAYPETCEAYG